MNLNESNYLAIFREASAKKQAVGEAIRDLQGVCSSLANWRDTAATLAGPSGFMKDEWSEEKLKSTYKLRQFLVEYHRVRERVTSLWSQLKDDERIGLAPPSSLDS